ncbi:MAG: hypothetical protein AAGB01_01030 [Cyanobacteria bacterium P01_F01_bin.42]
MNPHFSICDQPQSEISQADQRNGELLEIYHRSLVDAYDKNYWINIEVSADCAIKCQTRAQSHSHHAYGDLNPIQNSPWIGIGG